MGVFKKASKYRKPLSELKIKEDFLNQELKKTGMLSEKMSTSKMYYDVASQTPAVEVVLSDVPDIGNVRANGRGDAPDIDPSDSSTWATGGDDLSWMKNPNTLPVSNGTDVSGQNIFDTPDLSGFKELRTDPDDEASSLVGYGGIVKTSLLGVWGTSYGVLGGPGGFTVILAAFGWPQGGSNPSDRGYGGFYRTDDDATYSARLNMKYRVQSYGDAFYDANNWKSVKAWIPFNSYGVGQQWNDYNGIKRAGTETSPAKIYTTVGIYVGSSGKYESTVATPKSIVLRANEGLGDPGFFPGPIQSWLMNKLKVAKQAAQYLLDKSSIPRAINTNKLAKDVIGKITEKAIEVAGKITGLESATNMVNEYDNFLENPDDKVRDLTNKFSDKDLNHLQDIRNDKGLNTLKKTAKTEKDWNELYDFYSREIQKRIYERPGLDNSIHNDPVLDKKKFMESGGEVLEISKQYAFRPGGSVAEAEKKTVGKLLTKAGVKLDTGGTGLKFWLGVLAAEVGITNDNKYGGVYNSPGMNYKVVIPVDKIPTTISPSDVKKFKTLGMDYEPEGEVISEQWHSPKHVDVDPDQKKRWFKEKDIQPEYPKKAPPKQVNGWHPDLVDKPIDNPTIKITKDELIRNHRLTDAEVEEWTNTINALNAYIDAYPEELIHARQRYPVSDPRLAELNWKMDTMLGATEEFLDKKYPENTRLFNQLQKSVKRSIKLTDPTTFKVKLGKETSYKKLLNVDYITHAYSPTAKKEIKVKVKQDKDKKKSAVRFFRKERKKTKSEILDLRIKQLDIDMQKTLTNP